MTPSCLLVLLLFRKMTKRIRNNAEAGSYDTSWSNHLPTDMMRIILQRLSLNEHFRFAAVCQSWQSVVTDQFCNKSCPSHVTQLPLLVFGSHPDPYNDHVLLNLNHGNHKIVKPYWPEIVRERSSCIGCIEGWLIMADFGNNPLNEVEIFFLNPIISARVTGTNNKIMLPSYSDISEQGKLMCRVFLKAVASAIPTSSDCVVAAITTQSFEIVYCRPGMDKVWTPIETTEGQQSYDDIIFHDGKLYALPSRTIDFIIVFDLLNAPPSCSDVEHTNIIILNPPPPRGLLTVIHEITYASNYPLHYWVEDYTKQDLMMVEWVTSSASEIIETENGELTEHYIVPPTFKDFQVLKLDESSDEWAEVDSLDDRVLFVGETNSVCLSTKGIMDTNSDKAEGNCIYFARDRTCLTEPSTGRDVWKFSLSDRSLNRILQRPSPLRHTSPPIWFSPTPW